MATIVLTNDDFLSLSSSARGEIMGLFQNSASTVGANSTDGSSQWTGVPRVLMSKFMTGVSEQSKKMLRLFAENDGELKWSQIKAATHFKEWQDLKGFQAGMNRRLRGLLDDPEAIFVSWDETQTELDEDDLPIDGLLKVHPETATSLRTYFRLPGKN